ncbi:MAG TPA: hypothetical protein VG891_07095 [Rhizomicrobium sp.]|nr:hypothetical protein [Rhizomicrobium sp.]
MRNYFIAMFTVAACVAAPSAFAQGDNACMTGLYRSGDQDALIVARRNANEAMNYLFLDGRSGKVSDADSPLHCRDDSIMTRTASGAFMVWRKVDLKS